ncbi:MAG TPA: EAL domain-containing protein [Solirubrobacter sp.]
MVRRLKSVEPVWWLICLTATAAAVLYLGWLRHFGPILGSDVGWWWALGIVVFVAERRPVELEIRHSGHSFSLTDVPLTLALIFTSGTHAFVAVMAGVLLALLLRRGSAVKVAFNLAQFALVTSVLIVAVHVAADADPGFGWPTWGAVLIAAQAGSVLTTGLILAAMSLTEGRLSRPQIREMFGLDQAVALVGTALALVGGILWIERPDAVPLLLIPLVLAFVGYRAYIQEREGHEKVKTLYDASPSLSGSPEVAVAVEGLLERALEAFHAEQAEVILFAADDAVPVRTSLGPGTAREAMAPLDAAAAAAVRACAVGSEDTVALLAPFPAGLDAYLHSRGVRHGMLGVLRREDHVIGTIMLANRFGLTRGFSADDRALFGTLAANVNVALRDDRLEHAVSELQALQERLQHQAHHDALTGLVTRSLFSRQVRQALAARSPGEAAVIVVDLDDFKSVNARLGRAIGDELLRGVASRLTGSSGPDDVVARLDGDVFAILVRSVSGRAVELAERTMRAFALPVTAGAELLDVSVSIGLATGRDSATNVEGLLWDANVAMYAAKEAGKRRYAIFTPAMRESIIFRSGLTDELARAIEQRELVVQYQPLVDLVTGRTISVEALVRWDHPVRGRIPPIEFIPLAEATGLIVPLGRYVLAEACSCVAERYPGVQVHVNLSALELEQPDVLDAVKDVIGRIGIAPGRLVLEVTETLLVKDAVRGVETLQQLRDLGVQLALDDFGTGYSSLSYLRNLPLDSLKIAREFVEGMAFSEHDAAFVRLIVGLAKTIGLKVVAEGIETREQLDMLRDIGCDLGQGYYFSKPMDFDADWLTPNARRSAAV